ncbi:peptide-aspartate beta-dioxygenase [Gammaproteobacteria bacterium 45_16_T64]|nr:peptide-aspartate beta-dioxygenase [Gammaproteobacteria bacterium 45_16_T64]
MKIPNPFRIFNPFFDLWVGGKNRPIFFDVDQSFPSLRSLDDHVDTIKEELMGVLQSPTTIPKYHELDKFQYPISGEIDADKDWKVFLLYALGQRPDANRKRCPKTVALLDDIPHVFQAFFSILEAGKSIPAHEGPYRGYLRYHLGVDVPKDNPPSIRIHDQWYTWKQDDSVFFDDSWNHEVVNSCKEDRVVLIVDVFRPMPKFPNRVNHFVHDVFGTLYGKLLTKNIDT